MNRLFRGFAALLLTAAMSALTPSAYADAPIESDYYGVKIKGYKESDEESERRRGPRGPKSVEDCFTFENTGYFYSEIFGEGEWEAEEVLFFEVYTVTTESGVTLTLIKLGDKLIGIGRDSEQKFKTYRIEGEADDCGAA